MDTEPFPIKTSFIGGVFLSHTWIREKGVWRGEEGTKGRRRGCGGGREKGNGWVRRRLGEEKGVGVENRNEGA